MMTKEMVLFESSDGKLVLPVQMDGNTVWLSQKQMAELFGKDQSVISRHIKNAVSEGEIDISADYAKFAYSVENVARMVEIGTYDIDVVVSVGYRVHSSRGVEFRRWATKVLKDYIVKGAAINKKRLQQLGQAVEVMKRVSCNKLMFRKDGSKRIADHTLVALTVMIAESRPQEKEMMVNLVMTFLK